MVIAVCSLRHVHRTVIYFSLSPVPTHFTEKERVHKKNRMVLFYFINFLMFEEQFFKKNLFPFEFR